MSNEELYIKLEIKHSPEEIKKAAPVIASMYDLLFRDDWTHGRMPSENKYDAEWWYKQSKELV